MPGRVGDRSVPRPELPRAVHHRPRRRTLNTQPKEDLVLRPKLDWRAAVCGGALIIAYSCAAAVPAPAPADTSQGTPTATASKVGVTHRRLNVKLGRRAEVRGAIQPAGSTVALQIRRGHRWVTLDRDRSDASGRYRLHDRLHRPVSARARVKVSKGGPAGHRGIGRLNVFRIAHASWYGPGLYGGHPRRGGTPHARGPRVAHKPPPRGPQGTPRPP